MTRIEKLIEELQHNLDLARNEEEKSKAAQEVRRVINSLEGAYENPECSRFLRSMYSGYKAGSPGGNIREGYLLTVGPHDYGCVVFQAPEAQQNKERRYDKDAIDRPLLIWPLVEPEKQLIELDTYRKLIMDLSILEGNPYAGKDGEKFALTALHIDDRLRLQCNVSWYYKVLSTSEYLKMEVFEAWVNRRKEIEKALVEGNALHALPWRSRLHEEVGDPILSGKLRGAGLSTSTLVCYRSEIRERKGYRCILFKRSDNQVSEAPGWFHVVPAGQFESDPAETLEGSFSVAENVLREYGEEFFDCQRKKIPLWHRHEEPVKAIIDMMTKKAASLHLTGISFELATLRADICTLLLITSPDWEQQWLPRIEETWEHKGDEAQYIWLEDTDEAIYGNPEYKVGVSDLYVQGATAFWLGVRLARQIIENSRRTGERQLSDGGQSGEDREGKKFLYCVRYFDGKAIAFEKEDLTGDEVDKWIAAWRKLHSDNLMTIDERKEWLENYDFQLDDGKKLSVAQRKVLLWYLDGSLGKADSYEVMVDRIKDRDTLTKAKQKYLSDVRYLLVGRFLKTHAGFQGQPKDLVDLRGGFCRWHPVPFVWIWNKSGSVLRHTRERPAL